MPAGIVEGADFAVAAAHDHHWVVADLHREEAARLGDLAIVADEQPFAIPDKLHVELVEIRVDVEGLLQAEAVAPVADQFQHFVAHVHVRPRKSQGLNLVVMEVEGRGHRRSWDRPEALCLLTAHRDQSSSKRSRLVSGLRSCPCGTVPTPSRAFFGPVVSRRNSKLRYRCGGSAGIKPASQLSFGQFTEEHLERGDLITDARVPSIRKRHRESAKTTGLFHRRSQPRRNQEHLCSACSLPPPPRPARLSGGALTIRYKRYNSRPATKHERYRLVRE